MLGPVLVGRGRATAAPAALLSYAAKWVMSSSISVFVICPDFSADPTCESIGMGASQRPTTRRSRSGDPVG